jgi:hypothetical protein
MVDRFGALLLFDKFFWQKTQPRIARIFTDFQNKSVRIRVNPWQKHFGDCWTLMLIAKAPLATLAPARTLATDANTVECRGDDVRS